MTQSIIPCILMVHLPKKAKTTANCCKRGVSIQNVFAYNTDRIQPLYAGRVKMINDSLGTSCADPEFKTPKKSIHAILLHVEWFVTSILETMCEKH